MAKSVFFYGHRICGQGNALETSRSCCGLHHARAYVESAQRHKYGLFILGKPSDWMQTTHP